MNSRLSHLVQVSSSVFELNHEAIEERKKEKYIKNKIRNEKYKNRNYSKNQRLNNPEYVRKRDNLSKEKRRALERNLPSRVTNIEWMKYSNKFFDDKCALTGHSDYHLDHFIPLSWGHGGTYIGNIVPLSSKLNLSKGNKNPFTWISMMEDVNINKFNELVEHLAELNNMSINEFKDYVYWCERNKRDKDDIIKDGNKTSLQLYIESKEKTYSVNKQSPIKKIEKTLSEEEKYIDFIIKLMKVNKNRMIHRDTIKKCCEEVNITYFNFKNKDIKEKLIENGISVRIASLIYK